MTNQSATAGVTDRDSDVGRGRGPTDIATGAADAYERIREFLDRQAPATPCLVMDLATVRRRYAEMRALLPDARICYAVKANPAPEVVRLLVDLGSSFDVASPGEIDLCLRQGASPGSISYGNTIKKKSDIVYAYSRGVRLFATDSEADLDNIAEAAPDASVFCRVLVANDGSRTPFGQKFGCTPAAAVALLRHAHERGLDPCGVSFHIGSQQLHPAAWEQGIAAAARVIGELTASGITPRLVNLGGGLPATYSERTPPMAAYRESIETALDHYFGTARPDLLVEPGRYIVGDAGVVRSEVVLVTEKTADRESSGGPESSTDRDRRWVYLDIGRYNGLAETEGEAIAYRLTTARDGDPVGPVVLAGPTCDGDDVLYQRTVYELPLTLRGGDWVDLLSAGAYTASYSSVGFNGFAPLVTHCVDHNSSH